MQLSNILTLGVQVRWQGHPFPVGPEVEHNKVSQVVVPLQVVLPAPVIVNGVSRLNFPSKYRL